MEKSHQIIETESNMAETKKLPPPLELSPNNENVVIRDYKFGSGWIREYIPADMQNEDSLEVLEIEYIAENGKQFRLSSLLPEGYKFVLSFVGDGPETICDQKSIAYSPVWTKARIRGGKISIEHTIFFQEPGSFLGLLHEIGHVQNQIAKEIFSQNLENILKTELQTEGKITAVTKRKIIEMLREDVIQDERNATAYALRKLKELRKQDIDLEPTLDTVEKLLAEFHITSLLTHELNTKDAPQKPDEMPAYLRKRIASENIGKDLSRTAIRPWRKKEQHE